MQDTYTRRIRRWAIGVLLATASALGCATAVPLGELPEEPTQPSAGEQTTGSGASDSGEAPKRWRDPTDRPGDSRKWSGLMKSGRLALRLGELAQAEADFVRAYDLTFDFRSGDPRTAASVRGLQRVAAAYRQSGMPEDFERMAERLIEVSTQDPTFRTVAFALELAEVGATRAALGQNESARDVLDLSLAILREQVGERDSALVGIHAQLALVMLDLGNEEKASEHIEKSLDIAEASDGAKSPLYARALLARGRMKLEQGDPDAAETDVVAAVNTNAGHYGEEHPSTAASVRELAMLYQAIGRNDDAEAQFDRVISIWDALPRERYQRALSRNELAWFLVKVGRAKDAEAPARSALGLLDEGHVGGRARAAVADTLATALRDQQKYEESELLYEEALTEGAKAKDPSRETLGAIAGRYAVLLRATGRDTEANELLARFELPE